MKKGPLNFLGRKNQSLFDTNIKIKDMDNTELVLESSAIPESGTASVRARPTVKHHSSSSFDSFQGFNVPTPRVPILPALNGPKINGLVGEDRLSNGSVISVPDLVEEEIFVPPPPSMAPPPPPFIPPPDFMGDLNSLDPATLQPPSMPAPKPSSLAPSIGEEGLTFLKPPPMAPPKPPSTGSSGSASSVPISSPPPAIVPQHPKFAPPQPPSERQHKTYKTPPPKPIRLSSISNLDSPPQTPAPPPPVQTPTLSTFNPQNTAKLYNVPQTSVLSGYEDRDTRPKQMLVLEDSVKPTPALVRVDGKAPKVTTPSKPVSKDVQELNENLKITQPSPAPPPESNKEVKTGAVSAPPQIDKPLRTLHQTSPQLQKVNGTSVNSEPSKDKPTVSPSQKHKFSPLIDRKLRNLKSSENNGAREGPVASPLALLMAAKERDKHRSTQSLSRENSGNKNEQPSSSIHPSDSSPNSFIVTPRSSSSSSLTSQDIIQESPKSARPVEHTQAIQTPQKSSASSPALVRDQKPFASPALSRMAESPSATNQKQNAELSPSRSHSSQLQDNKVELNMPLLPPPPEFGDFDGIVGPPPSMPPPDPPTKKAPKPGLPPSMPPPDPPTKKAPKPGLHPSMPPPDPPMKKAPTPAPPPPPPPVSLPPSAPVPSPPPLPQPKPPVAPKVPPPDTDIKPNLHVQSKPKVASSHLPANLSPSQATLLSILQKKMLEMDHKMAPMKEAEASSDDWGAPVSDEDNKFPVIPKATPKSKNFPVVNKAATLDMRELEGKVVKKYHETSSVRVPNSNGPSKHQYGMTFTVRPGTKNPITLVSKGES